MVICRFGNLFHSLSGTVARADTTCKGDVMRPLPEVRWFVFGMYPN